MLLGRWIQIPDGMCHPMECLVMPKTSNHTVAYWCHISMSSHPAPAMIAELQLLRCLELMFFGSIYSRVFDIPNAPLNSVEYCRCLLFLLTFADHANFDVHRRFTFKALWHQLDSWQFFHNSIEVISLIILWVRFFTSLFMLILIDLSSWNYTKLDALTLLSLVDNLLKR